MIDRSLPKTKRVPALVGAMLSGVMFAGFVASVLETPVGANNYLHEHLGALEVSSDMNWTDKVFDLTRQDRTRISSIVTQLERPDWDARPDAPVTGQALTTAKETLCLETSKPCKLTVRLGRELSEDHTNRDLRITNVMETSQRVTFDITPDATDVTLSQIANETRLFRFFQTQTGWIQKSSEVLVSSPLNFEKRTGQFSTKFSKSFVGINYYPASASWKEFWTEFPVTEIKSDLKAISDMNANSVRIFINHAYFEDEGTANQAQTKLRAFLDLCAENDVAVLVTLFDLRPDYTLSNLEQDMGHIDRVLVDISDHPAILGVDIKNQADLDFAGWGQGRVEGWLTVMARHIQLTYPNIAVTVGWSHPAAATGLVDVVDFVTYHEYENPAGFDTRLVVVKSEAGAKPVMITELGSTIWTPFRTTKSAEKKQASRLENQLEQSLAADGVFVWTLNDFHHVGSDVVGWRPWRKAQQRHFGLVRADGSARPARQVFQTHAADRSAQSTRHAQFSK